MKVLAILSQKGGAGKTTLALNLAVQAEMDGKATAIIDLDPQASATSWGDSRDGEAPTVVSAQASRLSHVLDAAGNAGAHFTIIDSAPHSESTALAAARAADLVLIPCRPAILDLRAIKDTIDIVRLAKVAGAVVLNAVPPRGQSIALEAEQAIASYDMSVVPIHIGQRAAFVHSLTAGQTVQDYEPSGKAANEIRTLYKWLWNQASMA
ncbi:AAA family ATPase [Nodosilinea sp. LEGE 07298]|uniref:ParA family partition ATPase n=1 Tax=Nodosilinea sp. LEGE 07298 TaxID=2777970 RepID=UPI00187FB938|nr:ParA family partition ATPase [Nodosilinea sp. LEGE 07298]MBE9109317.1 AAA family ATPase [Nodosilinea sp. LEGE 07298]